MLTRIPSLASRRLRRFATYHPGPSLHLATGLLARHAESSVVASSGDTVALATAVPDDQLSVDVVVRQAGLGRVPANRSRRDTPDVLAARLVDRSLRALRLAPKHVNVGIQAVGKGSPTALAVNAASAVGSGCCAAVLIGIDAQGNLRVDDTEAPGQFLYVGTREACVAMEYGGPPQTDWSRLLQVAHASVQPLIDAIEEMRKLSKKAENEASNEDADDAAVATPSESLIEECWERHGSAAVAAFGGQDDVDIRQGRVEVHRGRDLPNKATRGKREEEVYQQIVQFAVEKGEVEEVGHRLAHDILRRGMAKSAAVHGSRSDGRGSDGDGWRIIRPVRGQAPALPDAVHGSAVFGRGETQVLCTATLGPPSDGLPLTKASPKSSEQSPREPGPYDDLPVGSLRFLRVQASMESDANTARSKAAAVTEFGSFADVQRAYLQYDFPAYSTGQAGMTSHARNRRALGHGALAEKAILPVLPDTDSFPYAIRMTAEVTDSNGSSSMAAVCGATMALLDAGVPLKAPVAGVSVGLVCHEDKTQLLLDITGTEDHYGLMDLKVAGTVDGVTALQLDVKEPVSLDVLLEGLDLASRGRKEILAKLNELGCLKGRSNPKQTAPGVEVVVFDPSRKRDLVGPGGSTLRQLEERYGVSVDMTQEGRCLIFGLDREAVAQAKATVMDLVADVIPGHIYEGTVIEVKDFGAVVELLRNKEGILHISELTNDEEAPEGASRFAKKYLKVGEKIEVLCTSVDPVLGAVKLSRKALLERDAVA